MLKAYTEEIMRLARVALVLGTALFAADSPLFLDQPVRDLLIVGETTAVILKLRDTSSTGTV